MKEIKLAGGLEDLAKLSRVLPICGSSQTSEGGTRSELFRCPS